MKTYRARRQKSQASQRGMAAIFVTMIMMIVISLIVLGFAQVSRREVRQSLDRQLSSQAYLAAETGVNDALKTIKDQVALGNSIPEKPDCSYSGAASVYSASANPTLDTTNNVKYTCLLVTTGVNSLRKTLASDGTAVALPIHPASGNIGTMTVDWTAPNPPAAYATCRGALPALPTPAPFTANDASWNCPYGVVRLDFVSEANYSRASLLGSQKTLFLYPTTTAVVPPYTMSTYQNGTPLAMSCNANKCTAKLDFAALPGNYSMRGMAIYHGGDLTISATNGGTPVALKDAQIQIDVTGKAQDVLRRVQVRVPINASNVATNYALESASSICKHFGVAPGAFRNPAASGQDTRNPYCTAINIP